MVLILPRAFSVGREAAGEDSQQPNALQRRKFPLCLLVLRLFVSPLDTCKGGRFGGAFDLNFFQQQGGGKANENVGDMPEIGGVQI